MRARPRPNFWRKSGHTCIRRAGSPPRSRRTDTASGARILHIAQTKRPPRAGGLIFKQSSNLRRNAGSRRRTRRGGGRGGGLVQNPMMDGKQGQLQAVGDADLVVHVAQIIFDYLFSGTELRSDFFVFVSLYDRSEEHTS